MKDTLHDSTRRAFLTRSLAAGVALAFGGRALAQVMVSRPKTGATLAIEKFSSAGVSEGAELVSRIVKSEDEWRKQLSPAAFNITRRSGTEYAFSGEYDKFDKPGLYHCICCDTALFDSETKFDSRTGWPSFWKPISKLNVTETTDSTFGMRRVAVSCSRCDAHLGHVFGDGPRPTGLRYCMNSVALRFAPRA